MSARIHPAALAEVDNLGLLDSPPFVVDTLDAKVRLLARFPDVVAHRLGVYGVDSWRIVSVPNLGPTWVVRADRLTIALRDPSDLDLAAFIVRERELAGKFLRTVVIEAVLDLGLPLRSGYYHPVPKRSRVRPAYRCNVCACSVTRSHVSGSPECHQDREERLISTAS